VKRALAAALLVAGSLVVALLLGEIGLRVAGIAHPSFERVDDDRGAALRPGASGRYTREGGAWVEIHADGRRDRPVARVKPEGFFRLAVLGDSYAEAREVDLDATFWAVAGRELERCLGRKVEVLNFGASGYGTAQELQTLRTRVWEWSPDAVLVLFLPYNDLRNNLRALERDPLKPYFVLRDGDLVLDDAFRREPAFLKRKSTLWRLGYALIDHSRVLQLLNEAKNSRRAGAIASAQGGEAGLDDAPFLPNPPAPWDEAWAVTEAMLAAMHRESRDRGAAFWVATATVGAQVDPDPAKREATARRIGVPDLLEADRRVARLGEREGFPVVPLGGIFQENATRRGTFLHGFPNTSPGAGHWNEAGHRLAGETIGGRGCAELRGSSDSS
jgi:hypothetical protein